MPVLDYCTLIELKQAVPDGTGNSSQWGSAYDALLTALITRASRALDLYCNRKNGAFNVGADTQRYYDGHKAITRQIGTVNYPFLKIDELAQAPTSVEVSQTGLAADFVAWQTSDYILWPYNAADDGYPYWAILADVLNGTKYYFYWWPRNVRITGRFGFSTSVPDAVKQATIIQAIRWFKRGQDQYQDTMVIVDAQQKTYQNVIDPDVCKLVDHLRKVTV